uniref:Uncharacterized protein n=1 Tax=Lepeophtheirus salmonis TaxID=72036 RepID=A0A0K2TQQ4_LEPSM
MIFRDKFFDKHHFCVLIYLLSLLLTH